MSQWPVSLPIPMLSGFSATDKLPIIRTQMESGPDRVTRTSHAYTTDLSFSLILDRAESLTFRSFFEGNMVNWFMMPVDTGSGVAEHRVRIMSVSFQPLGNKLTQVTCSAETDDRIGEYG